MNPLFSIITVARNASGCIRPTLESIASQTCPLYEYVVIDGASTDDTLDLVKAAAIPYTRILSEPDNGLYDAMNKGLAMAKGDYVIFLNAGDAFHSPDTLAHLAEAAMENDYPGIIYGQTDVVDAERHRIGPRHLTAPAVLTLDSFRDGMVVCHQAFTVLRKLTDNFDTRLRFSADYEWCIRCLQRSKRNCYLDEVTIDYLDGGLSVANRRRSLMERFRIMTHYYGLFPTLWRHVGFLLRDMRRRGVI